jgi:HemY protein
MVRFFIFLVLITLLAASLSWVIENPGEISIVWQGYRIETSVPIAFSILALLIIGIVFFIRLLQKIVHMPSALGQVWCRRNEARGRAAMVRGMIAAGSGDVPTARKAMEEATKHASHEPLTLLLQAQVAQLSNHREQAHHIFATMAQRPETRLLGLRGLHVEAQRIHDEKAAFQYAKDANQITPLQWASASILDYQAQQRDWVGALQTLNRARSAKLFSPHHGSRLAAVLETAQAQDLQGKDPKAALNLALNALKNAPSLVPACIVAVQCRIAAGQLRRAAKMVETLWIKEPHPDLGALYLTLRHGDSVRDRFVRAQQLASLHPHHYESRLLLARAALDAHEFVQARIALGPLVEDGQAPTVRMCLLMAELEHAEQPVAGQMRLWLARAALAPRDAAWVADGIVLEHWVPVSPVSGTLDGCVWKSPNDERTQTALAGWLVESSAQETPQSLLEDQSALTIEENDVDEHNDKTAQEIRIEHPDTLPPPVETTPEISQQEMAKRQKTHPVVFPHPAAPDDPGPKKHPEHIGRQPVEFI